MVPRAKLTEAFQPRHPKLAELMLRAVGIAVASLSRCNQTSTASGRIGGLSGTRASRTGAGSRVKRAGVAGLSKGPAAIITAATCLQFQPTGQVQLPSISI